MELVEVVIQGLRGFPSLTRITPAQGLTFLEPADGREEAVSTAVLELLFPKDVEGTALQRYVDPAAEAPRVGVTVRGRDGNLYRLLRDLATGKGSLLKEGAGGFSPVTNRANEIAQVVTAQIGFPQEDIVRELFFTRRQDLPSQRTERAPAVAPAPAVELPGRDRPLPPGFEGAGGSASTFGHLSDDEKRKKLDEIRSALQQIERVRALEFELDGMQKQGFELEERLRPLDTLRKNVKAAEETLSAFAHLAEVPDDLPAQWERFEGIAAVQRRELAGLDEERERLKQRLARELAAARDAGGYLRAALRDPFLLWGSAAGVGAILLALVGALAFEPLRWIAFLDIPAFGVALFGGFRFISEAEVAARIRFQIERLGTEVERIKSRAELDQSHFHGLLARYHLQPEDMGRVMTELESRARARAARDEAQAALEQTLGQGEVARLVREREELAGRIKALEEQLYAMGGYMGDAGELRAQAEELERELAGHAPVAAPAPERSGPVAVAPPVVDLTARLMDLGKDLFLVSMDDLCQTLQARVGQYVMGLSDRRYGQVIFGPKGEMALVETASRAPIPFAELTPGDRDIAYLSLKLTLIECYARRERHPVVLERAFETFPAQKDALIARMIQFLGGITQVICATSRDGLLAAGGHRVQLP